MIVALTGDSLQGKPKSTPRLQVLSPVELANAGGVEAGARADARARRHRFGPAAPGDMGLGPRPWLAGQGQSWILKRRPSLKEALMLQRVSDGSPVTF